ncbi:MAG: galactose mutarotase [Lentisphaeraceae bacterium]|nr:galactose mutarotase [Lentisphaeraceae bacterium]
MKIKKQEFGVHNGQPINRIELINSSGASVSFIEFGARLVSLNVPDKNGKIEDVFLGYDSLKEYEEDGNSFGATNGRVSNRIAHGKMTINGIDYDLEKNLEAHHIHGGSKGLKKSVWNSQVSSDETSATVTFEILSPDGDDGYPGNLSVKASYTWSEDNQLTFNLEATTDKACPINITQHAYFNLSGFNSKNALDHELKIFADNRIEYFDDGVPTGELLKTKETAYDFNSSTKVADALAKDENGFDVTMALNKTSAYSLEPAAELFEPQSGRKMTISTTRPGIHFYTANHLENVSGKDRKTYNKHAGLSLEPGHFPDAIHHANFPETLLQPGETFSAKNVYSFSVVD